MYFQIDNWKWEINEINIDNEVRVLNFTISGSLIVKSIMFPHYGIHKYTWIFPIWKMHIQSDNVLIDKRQHSGTVDV
jgi:hypothetical protein